MPCCTCFCTSSEENDEVKEVVDTMKRRTTLGPVSEGRRIRDVLWLIIFIAFCGGMALIAWRVYHTGNPLRIIYGTDSFGNICGVDNTGINILNSEGNPNVGLDLREYKRLYYRDPSALDLSFTICVQSCPSVPDSPYYITCSDDMSACQNLGVCYDTAPYSFNYTGTPNGTEACPDVAYDSSQTFGLSRCVPNPLVDIGQALIDNVVSIINNVGLFEQIISDFTVGYYVFGYAVVVAFIVCFLVIFLMRFFVKPILYSLILLGMAGTLALSIVSVLEYQRLRDEISATPPDQRLDQDVRNEKLLKWFAVISCIFTAIIWLLALALRSRIQLSVAIFQEGTKAITKMLWVFLSPILTNLFLLIFFAYWVATYIYMSTSGQGKLVQGRIQYDNATDYQYIWWYHLFGLFWVWQFILACQEIAIAGAVATWFYAGKDVVLVSPFWRSVWRLIRYHLGSVAFGSLIIAFVQLARFILEYINHKLSESKGPITEFIIKCMRCCLWCLEKFLRFINKNAYIEIAIYGYSFCTAARVAFDTLFKNIIRVGVLNLVTAFCLFLCKLFIVGGVGVLAYYYVTVWDLKLKEDLHYWSLIVLVSCLIAYIIADQFLGTLDVTVDTIFLCFAEDEARDRGENRESYMNKNLRAFLRKHNTTKKLKRSKTDDETGYELAKEDGEEDKK